MKICIVILEIRDLPLGQFERPIAEQKIVGSQIGWSMENTTI